MLAIRQTVRLQAEHKRIADFIHPDDRDLDLYAHEVTVKQIFPSRLPRGIRSHPLVGLRGGFPRGWRNTSAASAVYHPCNLDFDMTFLTPWTKCTHNSELWRSLM